MTITTFPGQFDIRQKDRQSGNQRTAGIHLSGILKPICLANGWIPEETVPLGELIFTTPHTQAGSIPTLVKLAVGFAWEGWIKEHIPNMIYQPGEFELDGVLGTPDGIELSPLVLHEFKATWKSKRKKIEEQWMWIYQTLGYARLLEEAFGEPCNTAYLHVLWMNGMYTYKPDDGPCYQKFRFDYAPGEVRAFWEGLVLPGKGNAVAER